MCFLLMSSMSFDKLHWLNHKVIGCTHCPRLSKHIRQIGQEKVKRFAREEYWAKPLPTELANCSQYLVTELQILDNIKVIVMLGKIGFHAYCRAAGVGRLTFSHGASYEINGKVLLASYHPSRQNTNTGKLTWQMWFDIFKKARSILGSYGQRTT